MLQIKKPCPILTSTGESKDIMVILDVDVLQRN